MSTSISLLIGALLLLISTFLSKLSDRLSVPALLIFLAIGMIFGSDGLNWVYLDDYQLAQSIGIVALIYILFSGGLDTRWDKVRVIAVPGILLSTVGVLTSALIVAALTSWMLDISFLEGMLLGSIVSSTDAAAVFAVLRSRALGFKHDLKELLEFESGTNDPMAIFLTIGVIRMLTIPDYGWISFIGLFVQQMTIGLLAGYLLGKLITWLINHINLGYDGLYPVLALSLVPLIYAGTDLIGGSGFLAVYVAGLVLGNSNFIHRRSLVSFFDGMGWLMQIVVFLTFGLLVFPNEIMAIAGTGLFISFILILIARPVSVFISLLFTQIKTRAKWMISWTGLRGAVPIIMATFPLAAGVQNADLLFNIIFFIVVTSVLIQGTSIPFVARLLHVDSPITPKIRYPIEFEPSIDTKSALKEIEVSGTDTAVGKSIVELQFPDQALIVLINREGKFLVPRGSTELQANDKLLVLAEKQTISTIRKLIKEGTAISH